MTVVPYLAGMYCLRALIVTFLRRSSEKHGFRGSCQRTFKSADAQPWFRR